MNGRDDIQLLPDSELERSAVVANCRMNRERNLTGGNGYDRELRFDPIEFLLEQAESESRPVSWLDLCCGTGTALIEAANVIEQKNLPIEIVGIDLVDMFGTNQHECLKLIAASLSSWQTKKQFDLITCIHGLHYIGDKLGLIGRCSDWLTERGRFVAQLDLENIELKGIADRHKATTLRESGWLYSARTRLLIGEGRQNRSLSFRYLGADDQAGPNYTGQPAVNSWYEPEDGS